MVATAATAATTANNNDDGKGISNDVDGGVSNGGGIFLTF